MNRACELAVMCFLKTAQKEAETEATVVTIIQSKTELMITVLYSIFNITTNTWE